MNQNSDEGGGLNLVDASEIRGPGELNKRGNSNSKDKPNPYLRLHTTLNQKSPTNSPVQPTSSANFDCNLTIFDREFS